MFKEVLTTLSCALVLQAGIQAQIYVKSPGDVGIGTNNPLDKFHVIGKSRIESIDNVLSFYSPAGAWQYLAFNKGTARQAWFGLDNAGSFWLNKESDGNIQFRMSHGKFYVESGDVDNNIGGAISLKHSQKNGSGQAKEWVIYNMGGIYGNGLQFWEYDNTGCGGGLCGPTFTLADNGNVGIGTTAPNYKLEVNGNAYANVFYANGGSHYPDYVFDPGYELPSLKTLEAYIKQNHHLPDVPSEDDVKKNGINLAEHQVALLKKIEELTLYSIDQSKQLQEQAATQKAQSEKLQQLEKAIEVMMAENKKLKEELKAITK